MDKKQRKHDIVDTLFKGTKQLQGEILNYLA